jgi:hypothetical protein
VADYWMHEGRHRRVPVGDSVAGERPLEAGHGYKPDPSSYVRPILAVIPPISGRPQLGWARVTRCSARG